ncbi:MAG: LamG domain-containing protein, partial [Candidatus Moraniibacteriota bacterium]
TSATDFSGSGNIGTLQNSPTWIDGKIGKAITFNGTNNYVGMGNLTSFNFGTGNFSYCAWVKTTSSTQGQIAGKDMWAYNSWGAYTNAGKVRFEIKIENPPGRGYYAETATINDGVWHHVCGVYDRHASVSAYSDGVLANATDISGDAAYSITNTGSFNLGGIAAYFTGSIDEVRVYNRVLTQAEITKLYQTTATAKVNTSQNTQSTSGLVGLWSFNGPDISGTTATDRSGNGNNGTLGGSSIPTITEGRVARL